MQTRRLVILACIVVAAAFAATRPGLADEAYPMRSIRLIVPYGAGGASDVMARQFANKLGERLGQPVVVENMAAAAGTVAYTTAARAAADGYTLLYGTSSLPVNVALRSSAPYDPVKDFQPVATLLSVQNLLVVPMSLPVKDVRDLVALAKEKPGALNYVSLGTGSTPHLSAELFTAAAGIRAQQVAYKQTTQAYTDLIEGRVQFWIASMPSALPHVRSGKLRALAVAGSARSPALPDIPTLVESGVPAESTFWQGLFVPARTSAAIVEKLNAATRAIVADQTTQSWYLNLGAELGASSPEQLGAMVQTDLQKWTKTASDIGLERN